jgi:cob(I)alamin adenosyltransferase
VKIYTRDGDEGRTRLAGLGLVPKTLNRVAACGEVEEANAAIGAAISTGSMPHEFNSLLRNVQSDLLDVASDLSVPTSDGDRDTIRIRPVHVERLEAACDRYSSVVPPPGSDVLADCSNAAGLLRLARAVTRRAERSVWGVIAHDPTNASRLPAVYLNRLSDLLLVVAFHVALEDERHPPLGCCTGLPVDLFSGPAAGHSGR